HAFRRCPRCSLAPRRRMVHPAGLEPAHAPGLSRLPLPIGLQMHWSGSWALLPAPPAWRAGALLNELLPGLRTEWRRTSRAGGCSRSTVELVPGCRGDRSRTDDLVHIRRVRPCGWGTLSFDLTACCSTQ